MSRLAAVSLCVLMMVGWLTTASADQEKSTQRFEVRRAEIEPGEGLIEATVEGSELKVYLHRKSELSSTDVAVATSTRDSQGNPALEITLTDEGAKKIAKLSQDHLDKPLAILVDGKVISAPMVREALSNRALITGKFTKASVKKLVEAIKDTQSPK